MNIKSQFEIQDIMKILPHRYPMILIDRITDISEGVGLTAIKNVTINEPYFAGHFPGQPVMPCLLYTSPSPRDKRQSRMPSSA